MCSGGKGGAGNKLALKVGIRGVTSVGVCGCTELGLGGFCHWFEIAVATGVWKLGLDELGVGNNPWAEKRRT